MVGATEPPGPCGSERWIVRELRLTPIGMSGVTGPRVDRVSTSELLCGAVEVAAPRGRGPAHDVGREGLVVAGLVGYVVVVVWGATA